MSLRGNRNRNRDRNSDRNRNRHCQKCHIYQKQKDITSIIHNTQGYTTNCKARRPRNSLQRKKQAIHHETGTGTETDTVPGIGYVYLTYPIYVQPYGSAWGKKKRKEKKERLELCKKSTRVDPDRQGNASAEKREIYRPTDEKSREEKKQARKKKQTGTPKGHSLLMAMMARMLVMVVCVCV
jgi:hypothetical protein